MNLSDSSVARLVGREFPVLLSPKEERVKSDLSHLAAGLLTKLDRIQGQSSPRKSSEGDLANVFNQGPLLHFHYGDIDRARVLCEAGITLFRQLAKATNRAAWLSDAMQPYANLGRISAAVGQVDEALRMFSQLYRFVIGESGFQTPLLELSTAKRGEILGPNSEWHAVARNIYIFDSLRCLLLNERWDQLLSFLSDLRVTPAEHTLATIPVMLEAKARAFIATGRIDEAIGVFQMLKSQVGSKPEYVSTYAVLVDAYRRGGAIESARRVLDTLEGYLPQMIESTCVQPIIVRRLRYSLALQRFALGDLDKASEHSQQAVMLCELLTDEVGSIRALILDAHIRLGLGVKRSDVDDEKQGGLEQLSRRTLYRLERGIIFTELFHCLPHSNKAGTIGTALAKRAGRALSSLPLVTAKRELAMLQKHSEPCDDSGENGCVDNEDSDSLRVAAIEKVFSRLMELEAGIATGAAA